MCCREQRKEMRYDMKKIVAMLLALALFSFAAGCGDKAGADIDVAALGAELASSRKCPRSWRPAFTAMTAAT